MLGREHPRPGTLGAYGVDNATLLVRTAESVDTVLRGQRPGDIPIEEPTTFARTINRTTARALGLTIPPNVLAHADDVVQ